MHKTLKRKFDLRLLRLFVAFGVLILSPLSSYAEDLTTLDGKTFTNITEVTKYPKLVVFTYNSNRMSVSISNLPEIFRTKHGIKIISITNTPTISATQTQANPTDLFLWQNRDTDLFECDSDFFSTNHIDKSWQICLHGIEITLTRYETKNDTDKDSRNMHFNLGQEGFVNQAFDKFIEWDDVAAKNNAEPFQKEIGRCQDMSVLSLDGWHNYSFHWDFGMSSFWDSGAYGGVFYKEDVIHFREILKRLPAIKEKLADKIRNKEAQKNLFK
jgi:hypothetical protein